MAQIHRIVGNTVRKESAPLIYLRSLSAVPQRCLTYREIVHFCFPHARLPREVKDWRRANLRHLWRSLWRVAAAQELGIAHFYGRVAFVKINRHTGVALDFGIASFAKVTTAGVGYLVDALQNSVEPENLKYHAFGTGTNAESNGDTALQTELTTQYATDNTRPTGSQTEGASANIYRTVATLSPDTGGTLAITEHGILSQAATGGGVLLDRSVFSAINVVAGSDSLQATYDYTMSAEA